MLVIDDDVGTLIGYKGLLRTAGHEVATAALGEDGVAIAQRDEFDVVLCDQRLPDLLGVGVVHQIHESCPRTAIVLVTAWGAPELVIEAKRAGATSYAEKPLVGDDVASVVDAALRLHATKQEVDQGSAIGYAARRWADMVVRAVYLLDDPKTTSLWCRGIALSHSTLQNRCNAVRLKPKQSLDFARLLRVVIHNPGEQWDFQRLLEIVDDRTARALGERAGLCSDFPIPDLEAFLSQQRLIVSPELIRALRAKLAPVFRA